MLIASGCVVALAVAAGGWAIYQNDFDYRQEHVTITGSTQPLEGTLTLPKQGNGPYGLVLFIHGDGVANADRDGFYRPMWETFAKAGYASIGWNKPGIGGAPGNWLDQSLRDRALEAEAVMDWARARTDIDPHRIGLWGISQGGWVIPQVAVDRPDQVQFIIPVGAAINWERQGEYNLRAEMKAKNASDAELRAALQRREDSLVLLREDAPYERYRSTTTDSDPMSPDRWRFVERNFRADVSPLLPRLNVPVLLELGAEDRNVDVRETERVYKQLVKPELLTVHMYPDASHNIVKADLDHNQDSLKTVLTYIFAPRSLYVPGYLDDIRDWVSKLPPR
ncbi:alpha/beta hydrolase family protein [Nocardia panacis]|uniref:alpha/beta hydrolase family protein n=1 Tax=Nocardia panacis TaxID=2340916 RepID=UPI001396A986|nr:alpha/beta fold hydrolase [Nocardia panacis]